MKENDKFVLEVLGREIRHWRINHFLWTQEELAARSGLTRNQISLIENGAKDIRITTLRKIAQAFGMTVSRLTKFKLFSNEQIFYSKRERF